MAPTSVAPPGRGHVLPANTDREMPGEYWERLQAIGRARRRLWWRWVGAWALMTTLGWAAWATLVEPRTPPPGDPLRTAYDVAGVVVLTAALTLALRPYLRHWRVWALASLVGSLLTAAVGAGVEIVPLDILGPPGPDNLVRATISLGLLFPLAALPQWLALRRAGVAHAGRWLRLAAVQGLGFVVLGVLSIASGEPEPVEVDRVTEVVTAVFAVGLFLAAVAAPQASVLIRLLLPLPPPPAP